MQSYEPRPIRSHGLRKVDGWRLKLYSIAFAAKEIDWAAFEPALALTAAQLPLPAVTRARAGVGFIIAHQGRTALYCVLGWWDNENELPLRVFVRGLAPDNEWRPARGPESICVWDIQLIAFERDAYVATVLTDADVANGAEAYLSAVLSSDPAKPERTATPLGAR